MKVIMRLLKLHIIYKIKQKDPGIFFMTVKEFRERFDNVSVCFQKPDYKFKTIEVQIMKLFNYNYYYC